MSDFQMLNYGNEQHSISKKKFSDLKPYNILFVLLFLIILPISASARNPDLSLWTLNLSESSSTTELGEADYNQEIAVEGTTVHVIWMTEDKSDFHIRKIYYRRSTDNGNTWDAKQLIYLSTSDSSILKDYNYKRMTVQNNYVHIFISDNDNRGIYIRSSNNGVSFETPRTLISNDWHVYDTFITTDQGNVTIGFRNQCNYNDENAFLILNSGDNGATFTQRTVYSAKEGSHQAWDMRRFGNNVYVLYSKGILHRELYLAASSDGGQNFTSNLISIPSKDGDHKTGALQDNHYVPKITGVGNTVYVIWNGLDGEDVDSVFFRRSTNSGSTFENVINLRLPTGKVPQSGQETLAAAGNHVYALICSTASNVYFRRSGDSGISFKEIQELTATKSADYIDNGWWPMIALNPASDGSKVHVLWMWPTYCVSTDGGATFTRPELVSPYFSYSGDTINGAIKPQMIIGQDGKVHFVVEAKYYASSFGGYGDFDIFYRGLTSPPSPSETNMSLKLISSKDDNRFDNMQVPASSYMNFTSQMTAEVWVKQFPGGVNTGTTSDIKPIFHKNEKDNSYHYFSYSMSTRNSNSGRRLVACQINTSAGDSWLVAPDDSTGSLEDGVWNHLAMTYDAAGGANNLKLYLNGKLIASKTATGNLDTRDGLFFAGCYGVWEIDELRLWNAVRTESQIKADMGRQLTGGETGLNAYYTFNNTTQDITGHGNDGILMYKETWIPYTPAAVLSVSPSNQNVSKDTGTTTFSVSNTGTGTMPWTAAVTSGGSWLSIQSGASGSNTGIITGAFTANTGTTSRTGTIQVTASAAAGSPKNVTVTQAAAPVGVSISGSVKTGTGTAISGVTITFSNSGGTATTDSGGNYSKSVSYGYSGTATPAKSGYAFSPTSRTFTNVTANQTSQNFTGTPLSSSRQQCLGIWSDGVWMWDKTTNKWTMIASTSNASMIAAGKVDSDTIDDLVGVWPTGLYVKQSSNGQWVKLSVSLPTWIAVGDLNNDGRDDVIGSWAGDGAYYRNSATGKWVRLSSPVRQMATGNIGGVRDDLTAVYNDGLWVRYSADGSWKKIDPTIPIWITVGDMTGDKRADIVCSYSTGTWYRNSANGAWIKLTTPATQLAAGDMDGDGRDDLVGIWSNTVYVRYGTTGQWQQISTSTPKWIATGKMLEATQSAGSLEDPAESGEEMLDMSDEGPGGWYHPAVSSEADWPMVSE